MPRRNRRHTRKCRRYEQFEARYLLAVDLAVDLEVDLAEVRPGDEIAYSIQVTNLGSEAAVGAQISSIATDFLQDVSWKRETRFKREFSGSDTADAGGLSINGASDHPDFGGMVSSAGDVNGDGIDDVVVSAAKGVWIGKRSPNAYVVFGSEQLDLESELSVSSLDGDNGFAITGAENGISSISGAGDVNGDGFDDLVVGVAFANENENHFRTNGISYVVYGSGTGFDQAIKLPELDGSNGFAIEGFLVSDKHGDSYGGVTGFSVSGAGDVNGDGFDDVLIGSGSMYGGSAAYVVFGSASQTAPVRKLAELDGQNGARLFNSRNRHTGQSVSGIGDMNGDGIDDLVVGAYGWVVEGFVVFGSRGAWPSDVDLTQRNGGDGFTFETPFQPHWAQWFGNQRYGVTVGGAGDVNGDGFDDLLVTATPDWTVIASSLEPRHGTKIIYGNDEGFYLSVSEAGDLNRDGFDDFVAWGKRRAGGFPYKLETIVIFGSQDIGDTIDLSTIDARQGFRIETGQWATSISSAGDVNDDGIDDLIIGRSEIFPLASLVVFGRTEGFPELVIPDEIPARLLSFGDSVAGPGDVNGDGIDDIVIGGAGNVPSDVVFGGISVILGQRQESFADPRRIEIIGGAGIGRNVSGVGDINGDGIDDILAGDRSRTYVVFGSRSILEADFIFNDLDGTNGFAIAAPASASKGIGDFNGDGFGDMLVVGGGVAYVVFGPTFTEEATGMGDIDEVVDVGIGTTVTYTITGMVRLDAQDVITNVFSVATDELRTDVNVENNVINQPITISPTLPGDIDLDGHVGFSDFLVLSANFGKVDASRSEGDLDGNGRVEFRDFLILSSNWLATLPRE